MKLEFPPDVFAYMNAANPAKDFGRCEFYANRVHEEYIQLKPWLPDKATRIVDIGCGLAGIDVHLARHYPRAMIDLVDGQGDHSNRVMGYNDGTQPWANVGLAVQLVEANAPGAKVRGNLADPNALFERCDLMLSFKSWAHHYPVQRYLPLAKRSVVKGGTVILDIRSGTDGKQQLEAAGFEARGVVLSKPKCDRIVFVRAR